MKNYKILLLLPIFKNLKFCQNVIFNQENFIARSSETRSLSEALNSNIFMKKLLIYQFLNLHHFFLQQ